MDVAAKLAAAASVSVSTDITDNAVDVGRVDGVVGNVCGVGNVDDVGTVVGQVGAMGSVCGVTTGGGGGGGDDTDGMGDGNDMTLMDEKDYRRVQV